MTQEEQENTEQISFVYPNQYLYGYAKDMINTLLGRYSRVKGRFVITIEFYPDEVQNEE